MRRRCFHLADYIQPSEAFHFARKTLDDRLPRLPHFHDYHELFLVEHGTLRHVVNGHAEQLGKGGLVFIRPQDTHALAARRGTDCRILNVMFRNATAEHMASRYGGEFGERFFWSREPVPDRYQLSGPRLERAVNTALELQTSLRTLARIEEFLLTIMTRVVDLAPPASSAMPIWLKMACVEARRPEVFRRGSAGFVDAAGRGHEHVCRMARKHLGMSPSTYVNRTRMEHAAMLLSTQDISIADVAIDCGIENLSHFYRLFRQNYGVTPHVYRRAHQRDPV